MNSDSTARADATIPALKCLCGHFARIDEVTACRFCDCAEHRALRPSAHQGYDPQTPPGAEAALQSFSEALEPARRELAEAADEEVEAELARDAARRKWMLSDECPKVKRNEWTVAERDAWVEDKIAAEERTFRLAREKRKAAAKALEILARQGSLQQSLSKSVGESYRGQQEGWR